MRIIKKGKIPNPEKEMTCDNCGCVFAYMPSDVHHDQREGLAFVYCPTCKKAIAV